MNASTFPSTPLFRQRWFLAGLCLFFLAVTLLYFLKVHQTGSSLSAFNRWQPQIEEIDQGVNIWAKYGYPNPPIMVLILKPLADLAPTLGSMSWLLIKVILAVVAIHWTFSLLDHPDRPFPLWAKGLALLLALRPIQGDLMHGNVNLFILFLVVGALVAFCRGRDVLAGLTLALAIACKVTPALFLPYFAWKRSWKVLAGCLAGMVLFLWIIPSLFLGWQRNQEGLTSWYENMIVPFVIKGEVTPEHQNQSLPGLAVRLLTPTPSFTKFNGAQYVPVEFHNIASLDPALVRLAIKGVMALFALMILFVCRTPTLPSPAAAGGEGLGARGGRQSWRLWAEFSLIILGMLLFSERTWKHHCVTLLLPFAVACYALAHFWTRPVLRAYLIGTLTLVALLMTTTSTGLFSEHDRFGKLAQVYGAYVWAYVLLIGAMATVLLQKEDARSGIESERRDAICDSGKDRALSAKGLL